MDLSTSYMGLNLKNPIVASASPITLDPDKVRQLEDFGAAAVVVHSLFEEQIEHDSGELEHYLNQGTESFAEALSYFPEPDEFRLGPAEYLDHIAKLKSIVEIPVIGSLNGISLGGWTQYAKNIEQAGADGLELNLYFIPASKDMTDEIVVNSYIETIKSVKKMVEIPVAVKLSPYFTTLASVAQKLDAAGADGLVLFNRFYQPDFDLERLEVSPDLVLSSKWELRLPLRWIAILYSNIRASLAATSGVQDYDDVLKVLMAGGDVAMMASELLRNGVSRVGSIIKAMEDWMEENQYVSVSQMKGSMSQKSVADPSSFERANYMKTLASYSYIK